MIRKTIVSAASTAMLVGVSIALPGTAYGSWQTFNPWGGQHYCADSTDFSPLYARSISTYGQLYMLGCDEDSLDDAHVYRFDNVQTGNFVDVAGGYLGFISATPNGHAWGMTNSIDNGKIYFTDNQTWRRIAFAGGINGRSGVGIVAVDDSQAFVLASAQGDQCPGGVCIFQTVDAGNTWQPWGTDWDGYVGAVDIAYDYTTGQPWLLQDDGHVLRVLYNSGYDVTYTVDVGVAGLPGPGAVRLAVSQGQPWVIADVSSLAGGPVYRLAGGQWVQVGDVVNATDITVNPDYAGQAFIITRDWYQPNRGQNVMQWVDIR
jgi:hypothetical protein